MRSYTDKEIIDRITELGFKPNKYPTLVGIQNKEVDLNDGFNCKFFLYSKDVIFVMRGSGTTKSGLTGLRKFLNPKGTWIWKTDMYYEALFIFGLHQGRMKALRLNKPIYGYRDIDKDNLHEEQGKLLYENPSCNCHGISYKTLETNEKIAKKVSTWSYCCQVWNKMKEYRQLIKYVYENGGKCNYALLKEF